MNYLKISLFVFLLTICIVKGENFTVILDREDQGASQISENEENEEKKDMKDHKKRIKSSFYNYLKSNTNYNNGNKYFLYGNYPLIRIFDEDEYDVSENDYSSLYSDKKYYVVGVGDTGSPDKEVEAYFLLDENENVYIYWFHFNVKIHEKPVKLANSIKEFFSQTELNILMNIQDGFYGFIERYFYSKPDDSIKIPAGIYPKKDIRCFLIDVDHTFLSTHSEVNLKLAEYLQKENYHDFKEEELMIFRGTDEELANLIHNLNKNTDVYKSCRFFYSGSWGIINITKLSTEKQEELRKLGLIYDNEVII